MIFKQQENEKKRKYQQRVLDVEMGSFTPLLFGTNGRMGVQCQKLSKKDGEPYAVVITWLRTRLSFEILRAAVCKNREPHFTDHLVEFLIFRLKITLDELFSKIIF